MLHKPYGYLSQFVNNQSTRKNKKLLGELYPFPDGVMAIGRLDQTTEGLLLITTDGKVSELVRSKAVEKEYLAQVEGIVEPKQLNQLISGVEIKVEGEVFFAKALSAKAKTGAPENLLEGGRKRHEGHGPTSWLSITLNEGKFRQVRKMLAAIEHPCVRLIRTRIGDLHLADLTAGTVLEVEQFKI